jgi:hypothetical protein
MSDLSSAAWRKSTFCDNSGGNCVEVKSADGCVAIRDTKDPDGPVLVFDVTEWRAFIDGVKNREFDE